MRMIVTLFFILLAFIWAIIKRDEALFFVSLFGFHVRVTTLLYTG